jgi:hypothetical protein
MGHDEPRQTREGRLIEDAAKASGLSVKRLAANAGLSDTRWRHIVRGWQPQPGGVKSPVVAPASTLAKMAYEVGVQSEDLARTGRTDAAALLGRLEQGTVSRTAAVTGAGQVTARAEEIPGDTDEIALIYASQSMTARQKLDAIRMVMRLRAQAEAEEAADSTQHEAPADETGASVERPS